jgi:uncharacterized protein
MRRILSIDGGGIKGVFPASFLTQIEENLGRSVADYFDLIVGTSTGGIIALGLGLGLEAERILNLYKTEGPKIFGRGGFWMRLTHCLGAKYSAAPLADALKQVFGERKLGESAKRLVIPSFNLETGSVHNWKTSHHPRLEHDYRAAVVDVALATAAAPTYFPTYRALDGVPLIDGGIWANNPIAVAAVEAIGVLNWPRDDLRILSLGCTSSPFSAGSARFRSWGKAQWVWKLTDLFLTAQSTSAFGMAQHLVGERNLVKRVCPILGTNIRLDDLSEIPTLIGLGQSESRVEIPRLRELFFCEPLAEAFTPYHRL